MYSQLDTYINNNQIMYSSAKVYCELLNLLNNPPYHEQHNFLCCFYFASVPSINTKNPCHITKQKSTRICHLHKNHAFMLQIYDAAINRMHVRNKMHFVLQL